MINAQEWLDSKYSRKEKRNLPTLNISNKNLEGDLDLSGFISLKAFSCSKNKITNLNVRENQKLMVIDCSFNSLVSLDVSKNTKLEMFSCNNNSIDYQDLSNNPKLKDFHCAGNKLTNLNLVKNKYLVRLDCQSNLLTDLDLSSTKSLTYLSCVNNRLSKLDLGQNTQLISLLCSLNQLSKLDLTNNSKLLEVDCWDNPLNIPSDLKISKEISYFGGYPLFFLILQGEEVFQMAISKEWNKLIEKYQREQPAMVLIKLSDLNNVVFLLNLQNIKDKTFLQQHFPLEQIENITNGSLSLRILLDNIANRILARCSIVSNRLLKEKDESYEKELISLSLKWQQCNFMRLNNPEYYQKVKEKVIRVLQGDKELTFRLGDLDFVNVPKLNIKP